MAIILPPSNEANSQTVANIEAAVIAAQNAFIASTTVLINNAINNGLFFVEPYLVPLVTPDFVTTYFEGLGYTVLFPLVPTYPYNPAFVPGFPEVLPPGYMAPFPGVEPIGPPRFKISWGVATEYFYLLENGSNWELEDGSGFFVLE